MFAIHYFMLSLLPSSTPSSQILKPKQPKFTLKYVTIFLMNHSKLLISEEKPKVVPQINSDSFLIILFFNWMIRFLNFFTWTAFARLDGLRKQSRRRLGREWQLWGGGGRPSGTGWTRTPTSGCSSGRNCWRLPGKTNNLITLRLSLNGECNF